MSSISSIEPFSEYGPAREERRDDLEGAQEMADNQTNEEVATPFVKAASEKQDQKTTVQSYQYTGKGSFIDRVF